MKNKGKTAYLIVSSEDDVELVKGGIGTYLGLLVQAFQRYRSDIEVIWLTESPSDEFFVRRRSNGRVFYVPKQNLGQKISCLCRRICRLYAQNADNRLFIEAADWEGLLAEMFAEVQCENIVKITRLHSVLELTKQLFPTFSAAEKAQIAREHKQILHTDIISAPTQYVYEFTKKLFEDELQSIPHFIIPNFINNTFERGQLPTREESCLFFNKEMKQEMMTPRHKNVFVIGSLEYRKGTNVAINIAKKLIDGDKNVHVYFLGHYEIDGDSLTLNQKYSLDSLKTQISEVYLNNIHICGYFSHDKLQTIYSACDTFLFTYRHDNFPGALVEACLTGKNIVYLPRGGCKDMMRFNDKILGLPFDGANDEEMVNNGCEAVRESLKNINKYSAETIKNKYIEQDILRDMCCSYGIE